YRPPATAWISRATASKSWKRTKGKCCASAPGIWPRRRRRRSKNERGHWTKEGNQKEISSGLCGNCGPTECRQVHPGESLGGAEGGHCHLQAANHPQPHSGHRHEPRRPDHFY